MRTSATTSSSVRHGGEDGPPVDRDAVGHRHEPVGLVPLGQRDALVQAEQVRAPAVLDHDDDVVHAGGRSRRARRRARRRPAPRTAPRETSSTRVSILRPDGSRAVLLAGLDPAQRRAVTADEQPAVHPGRGRVGQDPGAHPPHRLPRRRRARRSPPRARPHLHPQGRRPSCRTRLGRARAARPAHRRHLPRDRLAQLASLGHDRGPGATRAARPQGAARSAASSGGRTA